MRMGCPSAGPVQLRELRSTPPPWATNERNVRTYVHKDGVPGVWFLSRDASNPLAAWGARRGFFLPYFHANIRLETNGHRFVFRSLRNDRGTIPAGFQAVWHIGSRLPDAAPGTRDLFLIERYCLYASSVVCLYRARIHHQPWPLARADIEQLSSSVVESHGLPGPQQAPLVHAQAKPLRVWVWPPKRIH